MGITALPNPPNSGNPATFNDDADTFLGALPTMVTEINALLPSIAAKLWATVGSGSTANALVLVCGFTALKTGMQIRFRATAANTGAATINLDGLGAKACRTVTGVALPAGYIRTDVDTLATYDGTYWVLDRAPELGSNANGSYLRHANGLMECYSPQLTADSTIAAGSLFRTDVVAWTYPAAFVGNISPMYGVLSAGYTVLGNATAMVSVAIQPTSTSSATTCGYTTTAITNRSWTASVVGRWY